MELFLLHGKQHHSIAIAVYLGKWHTGVNLICRVAMFFFLIIIFSVCNNIGAYDDEEAAARAYDLAALKYWGAGTQINFPVSHLHLCSKLIVNLVLELL